MMEHFNKKRVGTAFNGVSAAGLTIDELVRREGRLEYDNYQQTFEKTYSKQSIQDKNNRNNTVYA